jgi:O-antigen/teichoic acid export membrane protein
MSTRKSLALSFLDRYVALLVSVASSMVLARLLTPADIGAFSIVMALLAFAATFRDFGAGSYLVQEIDLTQNRIRAVWTIQIGLGVALSVVVASASAPVAAFYDDARMRPIMLVLAANYLVNPFGSVTYAWLVREMRFDAIACMRFGSALTNALVSVGLAYQGHGPISLAWGSLAGTTVNALVATWFRPRGYPWMPGLHDLARVFSFGGRLTASSLMDTLVAGAPEFILGKVQGIAAAGYYSRANGLVAMFSRLVTDAINPVAVSLFSRESRLGQDVGASFTRACAYVTALSWSFCAALICLAHPAIRLLYGPQWDHSVGLTRWLALAMALAAPIPLCTAVLVGAGEARKVLQAAFISAIGVGIAVVVGARLELSSFGMCMAAASLLTLTAWMRITRSVVRFRWRETVALCLRSAAVATASAAAPAATLVWFGPAPTHAGTPLLLGVFGGLAGFLLAVLLLPHPLADEMRRLGDLAKTRIAAYLRG